MAKFDLEMANWGHLRLLAMDQKLRLLKAPVYTTELKERLKTLAAIISRLEMLKARKSKAEADERRALTALAQKVKREEKARNPS